MVYIIISEPEPDPAWEFLKFKQLEPDETQAG